MSNYSALLTKLLDGKKAVGFETVNVTDTVVATLTPPTITNPEDRAYVAIMVLEADSTANDLTKTVHFREDGNAPTASQGMVLGHGWIYELVGYSQITLFKAIGCEMGKTHKLQVTYYKLGQ